jgi:hypothetical protein
MKQLLEKIFNKKVSSPIFVGFGTFAIFTFIVYPGLTVANTILNILSALVGLFTLVFIFYYIGGDKFVETINDIEPGETEFDYIPKDEVEKIKKKTTKKEKVIVHPKVKKK